MGPSLPYKAAWVSLAASLLLAAPTYADDGSVAEPAGYRMDEYRAPVPQTLKGAEVISTEEAAALWQQKRAVFIDVMPRLPKPDKLPAGTIWKDKVRKNIPGSVWLPNVGYGAITRETTDYFRTGLEAHTGGDKTRKILFYCMTDCWMSWNAAKRAIAEGYIAVIWYPSGADGWQNSKRPLTVATPYAAP